MFQIILGILTVALAFYQGHKEIACLQFSVGFAVVLQEFFWPRKK